MAHMGANYVGRCGQACNVQCYKHGKLSDKEAVAHRVESVTHNS